MAKLAVIQTGGKQYTVKKGDKIKVEKLPIKEGEEVKFDKVLLKSSEDGKDLEVGEPTIAKAVVKAKVLEQGRNRKVRVEKFKNKTRQHTVQGHRQPFTKVEILEI